MAQHSGGEVVASTIREYGRAHLHHVDHTNPLLADIPGDSQVWMSHGDTIAAIPDNFDVIASTDKVRVAAYHVRNTRTYGIQFHPEVTHSTDGSTLLKNFVVNICGCTASWTADAFVDTTVASLKEKLGNDHVIMALS